MMIALQSALLIVVVMKCFVLVATTQKAVQGKIFANGLILILKEDKEPFAQLTAMSP